MGHSPLPPRCPNTFRSNQLPAAGCKWLRRTIDFGAIFPFTRRRAPEAYFGTVRPRALAVLTLIISSNFVGSWTGRPFEQN